MKKTFILALSLLLAVMMVSCSDSRVPDGYQLASSENEGFYLYVPEGWSSNVSGGTASAFYTATDTSNVSMTSVMMETGLSTVDEYAESIEVSLASLLPSYEKVTDFTDTTLGGKAAKMFDYTCVLGDVTYKYRQVFCAYSGYIYVFTYTSTDEKFDSHIEDVEGILSVLEFK